MATTMELMSIDKSDLVDNFYNRLVDTYGYSDEQMEKYYLWNGVRVDIAIWPSKEKKQQKTLPGLYVVVECRVEHIRIEIQEYCKHFHSSLFNTLHFFVANNLKETRVFYQDVAHFNDLVPIGDFPYAQDLRTDAALEKFIEKMRNNNKEALLAAFSRCHNIIRNNDKLSPEAAFDEISKIIFIKMKYERSNPQGELIYSEKKYLADERASGNDNYMNVCLNAVIKDYETVSLFDNQDKIRIKRSSFLQILKELEIIDFYYSQEDVKGLAFETFLGKTFRGELGQFFTPRTIVNFMVDVLDIKEGETVCDPCCGSGGFLIRAFEHVQELIERDVNAEVKRILSDSTLSEVAKIKQIQTQYKELDKQCENSRMWNLCNSFLYGVDANPRMARTAKMNMIMHGDGHVGIYQHDGLMNVCSVKEGQFDVVLINPPYGVHVDRKQVDEKGRTIGQMYELKSSAAEALFIERTLKLLKPGGRAGLVLPEGVMTNKNGVLREYVEQHAKILNITSLPADVFLASGANVKPSLLFIQKFRKNEDYRKENEEISISMVTDAGINSLGYPSDNSQLLALTPILKKWIQYRERSSSNLLKFVLRSEIDAWRVATVFNASKIHFNSSYAVCCLSDILTPSGEPIMVQDDELYCRITVKLFNKGIVERDRVMGKAIGTKKQKRVQEGDFVVSKIDGKSGAFGYVPFNLEGAIVTQDFLVYKVDTTRVIPEFLELVLASDEILAQYQVESSGSTGRKRLQPQVLLKTRIPLPAMKEQKILTEEIIKTRTLREQLEHKLRKQENKFRETLFS